jgi:hypothetical protein
MRTQTLAALMFLAAGMTCQAGIVTYDFSGTIGDSEIAGISTGDTFSGSFSYDTETTPFESSSDLADYHVSLPFTFMIDSYSFSLGSVLAQVGNDVPGGGSNVTDSFALQGTEDFASGPFAPQADPEIELGNSGTLSVGPLTSTALPPDLAGFSGQTLDIMAGGEAHGTITLTQVTAPEPSGFLLVLTGLGGAALLARRRSVRGRESGRPGLPCE